MGNDTKRPGARGQCGWFDLSKRLHCYNGIERDSDYCAEHAGTTRETHPELSRCDNGTAGMSGGAFMLRHGDEQRGVRR